MPATPNTKRKPNVQAALKAAVKQSAKPQGKPAKAATPAKPAAPAVPAERAQRQALTDASRKLVASVYNGASLTVHASRAPKLADAIARIKNPVQRAGNGATVRDESLLHLLAKHADKSGAFDPTSPAIAADLGVLSRLASLGFITVRGDKPTITDAGAERARLIAKRA